MTYIYNKIINSTRLLEELKNTYLGVYIERIDTVGTQVNIISTEELNIQDKEELDSIINAHLAVTAAEQVENVIKNAVQFGQNLIIKFATENVLLGITQAGKTREVAMYLSSVQILLNGGSLYGALDEVDALINAGIPTELSPYVTEQRLLQYKDIIENYLGI